MNANQYNRSFCNAMAVIFFMMVIVIIATVAYTVGGYAPLFDVSLLRTDAHTVVVGAGNTLNILLGH